MQISNILNKNWSLRTRLAIARKLRTCSQVMKRDITNWKRTGIVTDRRLSLMVNGREQMSLSVGELINIYGMDPLTAMLFFDDLIKANLKDDKADLINLLDRLKAGRPSKHLHLTPEMRRNIKENQPELWEEYQKIHQAIEADLANGENEIEQIGKTELDTN